MNPRTFTRLFCFMLFAGGAFFAVVLPSFQVPDEIAHYTRAFEISRGFLSPPDLLAMPQSYRDDAAIFHPWIERDPLVKDGKLFAAELDRFRLVRANDDPITAEPPIHAEDIYAFPLYATGAIALAIVRPLHPTLTASLLVARLFTLTVCGSFIVFGLRLMPFGKELYAFIALLPMHLEQLASVSPDAIVISLALVTTAFILRLITRNRGRLLSRRQIAACLGLSLAVGFAKVDLILLCLLFAIPRSRFEHIGSRLTLLAGCFAIALGTIALAPRLASLTSHGFVDYIASMHIRAATNAAFVVRHPVEMARDLIATLASYGPHYLAEMIGTFGWLSFELPGPYVLLGTLTLLALGVRTVIPAAGARATRRVCFALTILAFVAVFGSLFVTNEAYTDLDGLLSGSALIPGVQGRYFLPFMLLPGIAIAASRIRRAKTQRFLALFAALLLLSGAASTVISAYYPRST